MDWLSKIFGTDFLWTAILQIRIKTVRWQDRPKPEDDHAHGSDMDWLSKIVGTEEVSDGDSVDSYKN